MVILLLADLMAFALIAVLYYGPPNPAIPLIILGTQIAQIIIILTSGILASPLHTIGIYLLLQGIIQGIAFVIGIITPLKIIAFHVLSTFFGYLLFLAVK